MTEAKSDKTGASVDDDETSLSTRLLVLHAVVAGASMAAVVIYANAPALLGIGIPAALVLTLVGFGFTRRWVLDPLRELKGAASAIVRGQGSPGIQVRSADEIGQLAEVLRELTGKLKQISTTLQQPSSMLAGAVEQLTETTIQQNKTVSRQAAALRETQATVEEIKQTSLMAAQKAERVLKVAQQAEEVGRAGEHAIEESLSALTGIRDQVTGIAERITNLSEKTRQIALITETVKDMADQSNMLALNAAIEAVRSGEHGKGFAVVAKEIRSLADQSIQATARVREVLEDISGAIRNAVSITQEGARQVDGGLTQVKVSGDKLRELSSIVTDNAAAVRQIAAAVGQQNAGITQIFQAVTDLNAMMEDTVERLEATNDNVQGLRDVSGSVSQVLVSLQTNAKTPAAPSKEAAE